MLKLFAFTLTHTHITVFWLSYFINGLLYLVNDVLYFIHLVESSELYAFSNQCYYSYFWWDSNVPVTRLRNISLEWLLDARVVGKSKLTDSFILLVKIVLKFQKWLWFLLHISVTICSFSVTLDPFLVGLLILSFAEKCIILQRDLACITNHQ